MIPREAQLHRRTIMATQQPAFTAYTVTKREGQEDWWTPIGAAFAHKNGDGYNIILQTIPLDGKIVLRPPKDDDDRNDGGHGQDRRSQDHNEQTRQAVREANDRHRGRR
jgi:hypothetical protein